MFQMNVRVKHILEFWQYMALSYEKLQSDVLMSVYIGGLSINPLCQSINQLGNYYL